MLTGRGYFPFANAFSIASICPNSFSFICGSRCLESSLLEAEGEGLTRSALDVAILLDRLVAGISLPVAQKFF